MLKIKCQVTNNCYS